MSGTWSTGKTPMSQDPGLISWRYIVRHADPVSEGEKVVIYATKKKAYIEKIRLNVASLVISFHRAEVSLTSVET
jgi:hypothetical protein